MPPLTISFFKENCSYHLLALLDYADPTLHLTDEFLLWTVPADTVRLIASKPGLVSGIAYRPSRSNVIRRKRESLPASERELAHRITQDLGELTYTDFCPIGSYEAGISARSCVGLPPVSDRND